MRETTWKFIWHWVRPYGWLLLLGVLLTIPVGALDAAIAAFLRPYMDRVLLAKDPDYSLLIPILIVVFTCVQGTFIFCSAYVNAWVGNRVSFNLRRTLFSKLLTLDAAYFDRTDSGKILLRFSTDAATASAGLVNNLRFFLTRLVSTISLAAVLFYNSWWLTVLALTVVVLAICPLQLVRKKMRLLNSKNEFSGATASTIYNETFAGNRTIFAYNMQNRQKEKFNQLMDEMFSISMRIVRHSNWLSPVMHLIVSIGLAFVLALGGWLVIGGHMTGGSFASFIAALLMMYTPLKSIGNNMAAIQNSLLALDRIQEILLLEPEITPLPGPTDGEPRVEQGLEFSHVTFAYEADRPVLRDISFSIAAGETVGIVGNSGGGKTSLVHLLLRLYDVTEGVIKLGGIDIRQLPLKNLRQQIAIVFQDNYLFSGTLRENILIGNQEASEDEVRQALRGAYLEDFVAQLPMGLDTPVGERGVLLSGGQKQRVAIARALLKNAPVVILDEATSALDNRAEALIQNALDNLTRGKTVLIIAHRLSTLKNAHKIFVLSQGQIVESGNRDELLQIANGEFRRLYEAQKN